MAMLNSKGLQKNSYSLFFAYVLDCLVWDILEDNGEIQEKNTTDRNPFWDGTFWMLEPPRDFSCGTNSLSFENLSINVNWSHHSQVTVSSYKTLQKLLIDYKKQGKVTNPEVLEAFKENELFDHNGIIQIPVITENRSDSIYVESKKIADEVAGYLSNQIDFATILSDYPGLTRGQKIIIVYHEVMWDILDMMEENGQIIQPTAFRQPTSAKDKDLKELVFIVEK
jgi:hypothetical protein